LKQDSIAPIPLAKGSNLQGLLYAVESKFGPNTRKDLLASLPPDIAKPFIENGIVVSGWYPLEWYKLLHQKAQQITGKDSSLAWELAQVFVTHQLGGIYKILLKFVSPHWLFMYPSMIFSRYFSMGKLTVVEAREGFAHGVFEACKGFDRNTWNATFGGCQAALERAGAKDLQILVVAGGGDGDEHAEIKGTWK
jgi:hypothetical protein